MIKRGVGWLPQARDLVIWVALIETNLLYPWLKLINYPFNMFRLWTIPIYFREALIDWGSFWRLYSGRKSDTLITLAKVYIGLCSPSIQVLNEANMDGDEGERVCFLLFLVSVHIFGWNCAWVRSRKKILSPHFPFFYIWSHCSFLLEFLPSSQTDKLNSL